jgi:hypothetical protein
LRQRHGVGRLVHLENAESPLHEGDDAPMVEVREDRGRAQPASARLFSASMADFS